MASAKPHPLPTAVPPLPAVLTSAARLPCRIFISWSIAGGLISGGFLVAATTLVGEEIGTATVQLSVLLWALGTGAGLAHGALLGFLARNLQRSREEVLRDMRRAVLWVVVGLSVSAILAVWVSFTGPVLRGVRPGVLETAGIFGAWLVGLPLVAWAALEGYRGLAAIYVRWPDLRIASFAGSLAFAALVTLFMIDPPEIWFTDLRVTGPGAVALAFVAAVWIALPVAIAVLGLFRRWRRS